MHHPQLFSNNIFSFQSDVIDQAFSEIPTIAVSKIDSKIDEYMTIEDKKTQSTETHEQKTSIDDPMNDFEYSRIKYFESLSSQANRSNTAKIERFTDVSHSMHEPPLKTILIPELNDLVKDFSNLWKTQQGCRQVQKAIDEYGIEFIKMLFDKILADVDVLIVHLFGNYVFQKLMTILCESHLVKIYQIIKPKLIEISKTLYGMRSLQAFVSAIRAYSIAKDFVLVFVPYLDELIIDANASHVIQKSLIHFDDSTTNQIVEVISLNCIYYSKDMHGCCVVQKCLDNKEIYDGSLKHKIVCILISHTEELIVHPYGNYVIQLLLKSKVKKTSEGVMNIIKANIISFSCDKFASHPVEMAYEIASNEMRKDIISLISEQSNLKVLLFDQYGNYVLQKILKFCEKDGKKKIISVFF